MWFAQVNPGAGFVQHGPPKRAILLLGEPDKSCCRLLGDFHGPIFEESMACSKHGLRVF